MEERENIRERLKKHKLSYVWLIGQLALRGIVTDKTEMSSVISGTRNGTKADAIIELSMLFINVLCTAYLALFSWANNWWYDLEDYEDEDDEEYGITSCLCILLLYAVLSVVQV